MTKWLLPANKIRGFRGKWKDFCCIYGQKISPNLLLLNLHVLISLNIKKVNTIKFWWKEKESHLHTKSVYLPNSNPSPLSTNRFMKA